MQVFGNDVYVYRQRCCNEQAGFQEFQLAGEYYFSEGKESTTFNFKALKALDKSFHQTYFGNTCWNM